MELVDASQRWGISGSLFNYLKKQPYAWEMNLLNGWQLAEWLKKYLAEKNIKIEAGALKELLILTDNDLNNLVLELGKLIAYGDGQTIALTAVRELIKAKFNDDIFALVDALGQKNQKLAVKLISRQLKSGDHELAILNMVVRQFKIMLRVNSALENIEGRPNAAQIAETLNLHPFVVQKIMAQAQNFTPEKLVAIYRELIELEGKFKNGAKNPELLFDLFAVKNC